jgi:polysaccharide export outer membrane protein
MNSHIYSNFNKSSFFDFLKNLKVLPSRLCLVRSLTLSSSLLLSIWLSPTQAQVSQTQMPDSRYVQDATVVNPLAAVDDPYRLGRSDEISIRIFGIDPDFFDRATYIIPVDGRLNLPWVGQIVLEGLTIQQAESRLAQAYAPFIKNPQITVSLVSPRSLRVTVSGQVQRPGSYSLTPREAGVVPGTVTVGGNPNDWPTVVAAIQAAGGLQQQADLRAVELRRLRLDGSIQSTTVDLWALLQGQHSPQDISLRDGDTIIVPVATNLDPSEAQQIAIANFSPDSIAVNIAGEVKDPGEVEIKPNSSLNQAILAAGGFDDPRASSGSANLIRLNADGTVVNRVIQVDYSDPLNEETNPALRDDDIVLVSRRSMAQTSDFLGLLGDVILGVTNPINGILDLFRGFDAGF